MSCYDAALNFDRDYLEAWNNKGTLLYESGDGPGALACFMEMAKKAPYSFLAHSNLGLALDRLGLYEEALNHYRIALGNKPSDCRTLVNVGVTLLKVRRPDEAEALFEKAYQIDPGYEFLLGNLLHSRALVCKWGQFNADIEIIKSEVNKLHLIIGPLESLGCCLDEETLLKVAKSFSSAEYPQRGILPPLGKYSRKNKIRIGYYSADFRNHPVSHLIAGVLESHSKEKFEIYAFSYGPHVVDAMHSRIKKSVDHFIDIRELSDQAVAEFSRELEIEIAVDLTGLTQFGRMGIFSYRAAPIQINYLGFPGTSGTDYMDYIIADPVVIPESSKQFYSEKVIYLPNSYQANDRNRAVSNRKFSRVELGLPESSFVFCCFNNNFKITPKTFDIWMRLLQRVPGAVLWLLEGNKFAAENLRAEAQNRGVDGTRLVFAKRVSPEDHLARQRAADLFLDTLPYNAHTTASDALWVGLPILTLLGVSFPGRVAASLLSAIGLPELVTYSEEDYENRAVELASSPEKLQTIKLKIEENRLSRPLFDTGLFTKSIEAIYAAMYQAEKN